MDRKALSLCAAAATCSLGALLIAGCGADSASPPSTARKEPRQTAPAPAVVVSPAKDFLANRRDAARDPGQPPVAVAQADSAARRTTNEADAPSMPPLDPWARPSAGEQNASVEAVAPAEEPTQSHENSADATESQVAIDGTAADSAALSDSADSGNASEALEPTPADSEIKFATSDTDATADEAAETTISLNVGPQAKRTSQPGRSSVARSPRPVGAKSELTPILVTPRLAPGAKLAQQEVAPSEEAEVQPAPTPAPDEPTIAKRAEPVEAAEQMPTATEPAAAQVATTPVVVKSQPRPVDRTPETMAKKLAAAPVIAAEPLVVAEPPLPVEPVPTVESAVPQAESEPVRISSPVVAKTEPVPPAETVAEIKLVPAPTEPNKSVTPAAPPTAAVAPAAPPTPVAAVPVAAAPVATEPVVAKAEPVMAQAEPVVAKAEPVPVPVAPKAIAPQTSALRAAAPIAAATPAPAQVVAAAPDPVPAALAPMEAPVPAPVAATAPPPVAAPQLPVAPQVAAVRSPAMIATLARADERVRHAIQLAEKGAMYASRKEFTAAISAIAQAHDVERSTRQYSHATTAGFQALKEASEFNAAGEVDVRRLVAGHKTPVLKQFDVSDLPPTLAAQHYYNYAKEQLAIGVGRETVGSIALYGLAKLIIAGAGANSQQLEYTGPAMALYQAALICEPQNFRAAHELGVLLAGSGQLELAREMLMGSVASSPQPVMLKNLAVVHSRLGEPKLAAEAQQKADILTQTSPNSKTPAVQWVDAATFASMGAGADPANPPTAMTPQKSQPHGTEPTKTRANVARKRTTEWNPLNLRR